MATGIVKGEKLGSDALLAGKARSEPYPLPEFSEEITITYPNKLSEKIILEELNHEYTLVEGKNSFAECPNIINNSFILADNYYGLKKLLLTHKQKVKLIYIDPPYGTGKDFQSRTLKHAYNDLFGTTAWVEFMRRRLILMRELLDESGSIYVHIGHQMLFHLKIIMDEVFGPKQFKNLIVRKKCSSKNSTRNQYPNLNDYILFYTKTNNYTWNQPSLPASNEWIDKEYPKIDKKGRYKLVPIHAPGTRNGETGKVWKGMMPPEGKHWQLTPSKLDILDEKGEIHWSKNGNPRRKVYLSENKGLPLTDYWDMYRDAHHQSVKITGYPTEKNFNMLKKIIEASSNEGDLVLDPFNGSGTTIHAARAMKRNWIGIDQSFTAAEATINRLKNGLQEMGDYVVKKNNKSDNLNFLDQIQEFSEEKQEEFNFIVDSIVLEQHEEEVNFLAQI